MENATNRIKDQDEWIIADGMQEAIISKELFDAAQERLKKIYKPVGKRPSSTYKHWLSGLLKCPVCGRTLTATTMKRANGEKYRCAPSWMRWRGLPCRSSRSSAGRPSSW